MRCSVGCVLGTLLLLAGCAGSASIEDSPAARQELAAELAGMSVEVGGYDKMLDEGAEFARTAMVDALVVDLGRELTGAEIEALVATTRDVLAEFISESMWAENVEAAFVKHFTATEIAGIRDFYASPVGKRMLEVEGAAAADVESGIDAALDGQMDAFIARLDEKLEGDFPGLLEAAQ